MWVRSVSAPGNSSSIAFHLGLGFVMARADGVIDGLPVRLDYAGKGSHRLVFDRRVAPDIWPTAPGPCFVARPGTASAEHVGLDEVRLARLVGLNTGGHHDHVTAPPEAVGECEVVGFAHDLLEASAMRTEQR